MYDRASAGDGSGELKHICSMPQYRKMW